MIRSCLAAGFPILPRFFIAIGRWIDISSLKRSILMHIESVVSAHIDHVMRVITDVQSYPDFLPGCESILVLNRSSHTIVARMQALGHFFITTQLHWTSDHVFLKNDWVRGEWAVSICDKGTRVKLDLAIQPDLPWIVGILLSQYAPIMRNAFERRLIQMKV